jgi:glycosyltransferase involved in cell wall biosynthesis
MVTVGTGIPCFVMEHLYQKKLRDPLLNLFRRWLYPQATGLVVLTPAMRALFAPLNARIVQIANPIAPPSFVPSFEEKEKVILLSGRLVAQKQFSSFVEHLSPDFLGDWRVEMAGEGAERGRIEEAIRQRGLSEKVILLGAQADMGRLYARASLFVLCSKQEGFSLVLAEAALYGCVRVSFLCPTGPEILIKDGETGYLIQDQNWGELLDRLRLLMQDDALRRKIYTASLVPLAEFDPQEVARQWQVLIEGDFHGYQDPTGNP